MYTHFELENKKKKNDARSVFFFQKPLESRLTEKFQTFAVCIIWEKAD